ncbi:hypothetical protein C8Q76DRAFT_797980 [Earliella scabrosa]|nr:hypothetical protein C8Q76DRAFT_797980 [Earliella scabrosa]
MSSPTPTPRILYATDSADIAAPGHDEGGRIQWRRVRVVIAALNQDTLGLVARYIGPSPATIPALSALVDEHFWYSLDEPGHVISITLYSCCQRPGSALRGQYTLRFHQHLEYAEIARFLVDAKTEIEIRQARLAQRLAELFAIQYTYARVVSSPVPAEEAITAHFTSNSMQTEPLSPEDDEGRFVDAADEREIVQESPQAE